MSERIRITPEQIIARNSSGNVTFNTDYNYLKTGSGTLFAGGNTRAPAIYGQNTIIDHGEHGGYCTGVQDAKFANMSQAYGQLRYEVPKCNFTTIQASTRWITIGLPVFTTPLFGIPLKFLNYDTGQTTTLNFYELNLVVTQFAAQDSQTTGQYGEIYYNTTQLMVYPNFFNTPPPVTSASGGVYIIDIPQGLVPSASRTYQQEFYGSSYPVTQTAQEYYGNQSIWLRSHSLFVYRSPTALSLAVTP